MNKFIVAVVGIVVIIIAGAFVISRQATQKPQSTQIAQENKQLSSQFTTGKKAPNFTLKDFDGRSVELSEFYGKKAVVLDFWAAWCPFCVAEMLTLQKAQNQYKNELVMIGVHRTDSGESIETGKKFADERNVTYLLIQGTEEIYNASIKGVKGMPVAVFIDKSGVVKDIKIGPKTEEEIKEKVSKLVQ